jgi:sugar lactone lactonase YvrE
MQGGQDKGTRVAFTDHLLFLGTMPEPSAPGVWEPRQGSLYSLHADYSVVRHLDRLGIPNGLDWSPDHRTFYHVDSLEYCVRAYDYDVQTGGIGRSPPPPFHPQAMLQDREGRGLS